MRQGKRKIALVLAKNDKEDLKLLQERKKSELNSIKQKAGKMLLLLFFNPHLTTCSLISEREGERQNIDQLPLIGDGTINLLVHRSTLQLTEPPGQG